MKTLFKNLIAISLLLIVSVSCSKSDSGSSPSNGGNCLSGSMALSNAVVDNLASQSKIIVSFNVKNNSSSNYSINTSASTKTSIYTKMLVKTTDGAIIETKGPLLVQELSAGATGTVDVLANYSTGKTYESYTIELYCQ